jgi:hypothetical protein
MTLSDEDRGQVVKYNKLHIPELSDHRFRSYLTTNSDSLCPLIPLFICPLFVGVSELVDGINRNA